MRITYLHQYFNTPDMAGGSRSFELGRRLVEMGHEVNMITSWREDQGPGGETGWFETNAAGIQVHWLPVAYSNRMSPARRMRSFARFASAAARRARKLQADVVFATSTPLTIALPAIAATRGPRTPMVFEVRDLWPTVPIALGYLRNPLLRAAAKQLETLAYRSAAQVVALAPGMAEHVQSVSPATPVTVIPNGCDLELMGGVSDSERKAFIERYPWLDRLDGALLVYTGTIGDVNDVGYGIELVRALTDRGIAVSLAIIGDGKRLGEVQSLAEDTGLLGHRIHFIGRVPKREVAIWLEASSAGMVTYKGPEIVYRDSVANKFFDVLAAGRPVLANYKGFASIVARDHGAGLILPQDPNEAASTAAQVLLSKEKLTAMGNAARKVAEEQFDRRDQARALESVLSAAHNANGNSRKTRS